MFCESCGTAFAADAAFCAKCGHARSHSSNSTTAVGDKAALGLSIASLIIGSIAAVIGLADLGFVSDGTWYGLSSSEIGLLGILSFTSLGLGIAAKVKNQRFGIAALIVSIGSVLIMFSCANYMVG